MQLPTAKRHVFTRAVVVIMQAKVFPAHRIDRVLKASKARLYLPDAARDTPNIDHELFT